MWKRFHMILGGTAVGLHWEAMSAPSPYSSLLDAIPVVERTVTILGSETHYWVYGPEDAAVTIVLVHGYRGEHHGIEPIVAQFRGIRFISPDLPAFGESTPMSEADHSLTSYANWLAEFMTLPECRGAILLGHSFGSIVTSCAVGTGLVTPPKLILINPIAESALVGPSAIGTRVVMGYYWLSSHLPEKLGRALLGNWLIVRGMSLTLAQSKDADIRRFVHHQHHTYFSRFATRATVAEGFTASVRNTVADFAAGITMPTLLVGAEKDPITSMKGVRALLDLMPQAELHFIPGVGHLVHYETPREAAVFIQAFVGAGELATD
jgi:pimeloyl-ACP methyl ester carboxylesterase